MSLVVAQKSLAMVQIIISPTGIEPTRIERDIKIEQAEALAQEMYLRDLRPAGNCGP